MVVDLKTRDVSSMPAKSLSRHPDRREQIIAVASELFLAHGLDGVSVDAVVDRAGGSKSSVYSYFGNKEGLFVAVVERLCSEILEPLAAIDVTGLPLEAGLTKIARVFLDTILAKRTLALHRLIVAESIRLPQLGAVWFAHAPQTTYALVARFLEAYQRGDRLLRMEPNRAAKLFLDMLTFDVHHRALLAVEAAQSDEIDGLIADAVDIFLNGAKYGASSERHSD
jgi:TetR/AcrR family transcriptional regulator, mexJK operon transcriptional repressor